MGKDNNPPSTLCTTHWIDAKFYFLLQCGCVFFLSRAQHFYFSKKISKVDKQQQQQQLVAVASWDWRLVLPNIVPLSSIPHQQDSWVQVNEQHHIRSDSRAKSRSVFKKRPKANKALLKFTATNRQRKEKEVHSRSIGLVLFSCLKI